MADITIKEVETDGDRRIYNKMTKYAFASTPGRSAVDEEEELDPDYSVNSVRYLLLEDQKAVSSLHAIDMSQQVRGKVFPMLGIAGVSTYPEARRKGYVKRLMVHSLKTGFDKDQVFTTLYPFRQSFYGRFGYINFPQTRKATFNPVNLGDIQNYSFNGTIERYLIGDQIDRYYDLLKRIQPQRHGMSLFGRQNLQRLEKSKNWIVFAVVNGEDRGVLIYSTTGFAKAMKIRTFLYENANARYVLLDYIYQHTDQFSEIQLPILADEEPENWMFDMKVKIESREWVPSAMGRVLKIGGIGGLQVGQGSITISVKDEYCPWNSNVWEFSEENRFLTVKKTNNSPDVEMTIQALSSLVYGYYDCENMVHRGWMDTNAFNQELINLFPPLKPELFSSF